MIPRRCLSEAAGRRRRLRGARLYVGADGQLIALDALTGKPCAGFGEGGRVDLRRGLKQRNPGYYFLTSAPALIGDKLIVGGSVADGQHVGEPSGVVRAYDAITGKLAWAVPTAAASPAPANITRPARPMCGNR